MLGKFIINENQINLITNFVSIPTLNNNLSGYKLYKGIYYNANCNVDSPKIGDIRITYSYVPSNTNISMIGEQNINNTISNKVTDYGKIYLQYDGILNKGEMIEKFSNTNSFLTNILRFLGWLLMFIGLNLIVSIIEVLLKVIPFISHIVSYISKIALFVISIVLSLLII